jgi:hypothetical protein
METIQVHSVTPVLGGYVQCSVEQHPHWHHGKNSKIHLKILETSPAQTK